MAWLGTLQIPVVLTVLRLQVCSHLRHSGLFSFTSAGITLLRICHGEEMELETSLQRANTQCSGVGSDQVSLRFGSTGAESWHSRGSTKTFNSVLQVNYSTNQTLLLSWVFYCLENWESTTLQIAFPYYYCLEVSIKKISSLKTKPIKNANKHCYCNLIQLILLQMLFSLHWKKSMRLNNTVCISQRTVKLLTLG